MTKLLAICLRFLAKLRFKLLGLATIKDIPTEQFGQIAEELLALGWKKVYVYDGFDAWIDYGKVTLRKGMCKLTLEWDNWTEGSIEGPRKIVEALGYKRNLHVSYKWRWSDYDSAFNASPSKENK